ncbi:TPA: hypothetical protein DD394_01995 [bacterium UBP9_UBA11836]|nr:hypothetical protein [bacterium UBP9_UBA11836]
MLDFSLKQFGRAAFPNIGSNGTPSVILAFKQAFSILRPKSGWIIFITYILPTENFTQFEKFSAIKAVPLLMNG